MPRYFVAKITGTPPLAFRKVAAPDPHSAIAKAYPEEKDNEFWKGNFYLINPEFVVFIEKVDTNLRRKGLQPGFYIFSRKG